MQQHGWLGLTASLTASDGRPLLRTVFELFVGIGIWFSRTRTAAMVVCILLHLAMALSLRISPLFHTLMLLHLALFLTDREWARAGLGSATS